MSEQTTRPIQLTEYEASLLWHHMGDPALEPVRARTSAPVDDAVLAMGKAWQAIREKVNDAWGPFAYAASGLDTTEVSSEPKSP